MQKNYIKGIVNNPAILLLMSFGVPASAMLWAYVSDEIGNQLMVYIAVAMVTIVLVVLVVVRSVLSHSIKEEFYNKIETLEGFIEATGAGRVSSYSEIAAIETQSTDITIITPSLKDDVLNKTIVNTVKENIINNKPYHYIVPDTSEIHGYLDEIRRQHKSIINIHVTIIPEENFYFTNDIAIYDLIGKEGSTQIFFSFPSTAFNLFIKLDTLNQKHVLGVVRKISQRYEKKKLADIYSNS